jgi:hypothetical protein
MRQASIILPMARREATIQLQGDLLDQFGGFTKSAVTGQWHDPADGKIYTDVSHRFDVAVEPTAVNLDKLRQIARRAGQAADQVCVYLATPSGEIEFIQCKDVVTPADAARVAA